MSTNPIVALKKQVGKVLSLTFFFGTAFFFPITTFGQDTLKVKAIDVVSSEVLPGANVQVTSSTMGGSTNATGIVTLENLGSGTAPLKISFIGYLDTLVVVDRQNLKNLSRVQLFLPHLNPFGVRWMEGL